VLEDLADNLENNFEVKYLEDLVKEIGIIDKIIGLMASFAPNIYYNKIVKEEFDHNQPAVVLFTSGTEGEPKAVVLSHYNIQSNRSQISARFDFGIENIAFNALPIFHCFGMTGMILMLNRGIKTFFYPSPLHYRAIPEWIYYIGATILFSTDTFLNGYAKNADPYDFYALRYVIAGAEKLKPETRQTWFDKFGVRLLEGYGVTESSPVISANSFMHDKPGTVGRLMPMMEYYIKPFEDSYFQTYCSSRLGTCLLQAIHKSNFEPSTLLHYYYSSYEKKDGRQLKMMAPHLTSAELCHPCYYATKADSEHLNSLLEHSD
jgi:acyl-[acyl-carrier-protein]-phospholipid O-acyltransferase/long-chain-fatty-acid--[acyl-carrier-protein] ligase